MILDTHLPSTYDIDAAIHLQDNLRHRLVHTWDGRLVERVAGIDVSYAGDIVRAAISVFHYPDMTCEQSVIGDAPQAFPYIPGLLAYRVGPAILTAWQKLQFKPDLLLIHGHGTAHPRGIGLAAHVGLWVNIPSIGVAKTRLYGCPSEPGLKAGEWTKLVDEHNSRQVIGAIVRTQADTKPIYVSAGHLIDLQHSIDFALACCRQHRMPEPLRDAHQAASNIKAKLNPDHQLA